MGFALVANHAFVEGNKRVGHAAMEVFLVLNDHEIDASVDEQERLMLKVHLITSLSRNRTRCSPVSISNWPATSLAKREMRSPSASSSA